MGTWKTYINVDHIENERWGPPLVDTDWHAFRQALYKGTEGEDCGELHDAHKEMSRAVGVKKPQEAQKARALWKGSQRRIYDPTGEDNILRRNRTRLALWEEHLTDPIVALDKALKCGKFVFEVSARVLGGRVSRNGGRWLPPEFVEKPIWEGVWPYLDPMDSVCLRTAGKYGPHGELFFFLIQKEPATEPVGETFSPFLQC